MIPKTLDYLDVTEWKRLILTNDRDDVLKLMEKGYIVCIVPQMFFSKSGIYGLHLDSDPHEMSKEESEKKLTGFEESARKANVKLNQCGIPLEQQDQNLSPKQTE